MTELKIKTEVQDVVFVGFKQEQEVVNNFMQQGAAAPAPPLPKPVDPVKINLPELVEIPDENTSHASILVKQQQQPVQQQKRKDDRRNKTHNGEHCGELFVSKNARKWTFVCTFCGKSTRDIAEFILHIKQKHLDKDKSKSRCWTKQIDKNLTMNDDDDDDENCSDVEIIENDEDNRSNSHQRHSPTEDTQSFMDCGNYLDVNVDTEPDDNNCNSVQQNVVPPVSAVLKVVKSRGRPPKKSRLIMHISKQMNQHNNIPETMQNVYQQPLPPPPVIDLIDDTTKKASLPVRKNNKRETVQPKLSNARSLNEIQYQSGEIEMTNVKTIHSMNGGNMKMSTLGTSTDFEAMIDYQQPINNTNNSVNNDVVAAFDLTSKHSIFEGNNDDDDKNMDDDDDYNDDNNREGNTNHNPENVDIEDDQFFVTTTSTTDLNLRSRSGRKKHLNKRRQIKGPAFCNLCNKTFQYYSLYRNHMIKHSNETPFHCVKCRKGFKSKQAIRYHMNTHQRSEKYKCSVCQIVFRSETLLLTHKVAHRHDKTFPCEICGNLFKSDFDRNNHRNSHTEDRPFHCEFCTRRFRQRSHLSNHLKLHRQYRCDYCKEIFTTSTSLRKPYTCKSCQKHPVKKDFIVPEEIAGATATTTDTLDNNYSFSNDEIPDNPLGLLKPMPAPPPLLTPREKYKTRETNDVTVNCSDRESSDLSDVEMEEGELRKPSSSSSFSSQSLKKRIKCKFCPRSYSKITGLNVHMRKKHG